MTIMNRAVAPTVQAQDLVPSHVFGLKVDVRRCLHQIDEHTLLYMAGTALVTYNMEQKTQKFIAIPEGEVSCMSTFGDAYVVLGIKPGNSSANTDDAHAGKPFVMLIDLRSGKKKKYFIPDSTAKTIVDIEFSIDGKSIVILNGDPEWTLCMLNWEKSKISAPIRAIATSLQALISPQVHGILVNQFDSGHVQVSIHGNGILRVFKFIDGNFKLSSNLKTDRNILCQAWVNENRLVVGTQDNKLLIIENGEQIHEIANGSTSLISGSNPNLHSSSQLLAAVKSIVAYPRGLVVGTNLGACTIYEKTDDLQMYRKIKEISLDRFEVVSSILSPLHQDAVLVVLKNSNIYSLTVEELAGRKNEFNHERISQPFHSGHINGLDTCVRKPFLVTCSAVDKSVRLWNFLDNTCVFTAKTTDEPLGVSMHPCGQYLIVLGRDIVRLYTILAEALAPSWEHTINNVKEAKFSRGGQFIACSQMGQIQILNTWTSRLHTLIRDQGTPIRVFSWSLDDRRIVSAGIDGSIIEWDVKKGTKLWETSIQNVLINNLTYGPDDKTVYVIANDGILREISKGKICKEITFKHAPTNIVFPAGKRHFITGNVRGSIRFHAYPLSDRYEVSHLSRSNSDDMSRQNSVGQLGINIGNAGEEMVKSRDRVGSKDSISSLKNRISDASGPINSRRKTVQLQPPPVVQPKIGVSKNNTTTALREAVGESVEVFAHSSTVTKLAVSLDNRFVFSTSEDGTIWTYKLYADEQRSRKEVSYMTDEVMVTKARMTLYSKRMSELRGKLEELKRECEIQLMLKDKEFEGKLADVCDKYIEEINSIKNVIDTLSEQKLQREIEHGAEVTGLRTTQKTELTETLESFKIRLNSQFEKLEKLKILEDVIKTDWDAEVKTLQETHATKMEHLRNFYNKALQEKEVEIEKLQSSLTDHAATHELYLKEIDQDVEKEIVQVMESFEIKLKAERAIVSVIQTENDDVKGKFDEFIKTIEQQKQEIMKLISEEKRLRTVIKGLERDGAVLQREIQERDDTIEDKERRASDLRKKNLELEKFKFVLEYKIKELQRQIEPRERDVVKLVERIQGMDQELNQYHQRSADLGIALGTLQLSYDAKEVEQQRALEMYQRYERTLNCIQRDLTSLNELIEKVDIKGAKPKVVALYQKYCQTEGEEVKQEETLGDIEARRRMFMERSIQTYERRLDTLAKQYQKEAQMNLAGKSMLYDEINTAQRSAMYKDVREKTSKLSFDESKRPKLKLPAVVPQEQPQQEQQQIPARPRGPEYAPKAM